MLSSAIREALDVLERSPGPVSAWCKGQLAAWQTTGDPSPVESDRIRGHGWAAQ